MQSTAKTPNDYIASLPEDRVKAMTELRNVIKKNLPKGFEEIMAYGMIGYVVPLKTYPAGYHCNPKLPLGYMNIASQKNYIALHHLGVYGSDKLLKWFVDEYPKYSKTKLDMGKVCIRFKKMDQIPYKLIGELASKITVEKWIEMYETAFKKK
jgi:uncharacterized protein YdhG (YjbR/CyaY superfamily)